MSLLRQVARSVGASADLGPVLGELLAPLSNLGSMPGRLATMVGSLRIGGKPLGPEHRVLDLACGKGAVGIELAKRHGCSVTGVDGYGPFLEEARVSADRRNVAKQCRWLAADVRTWTPPRRFHVAMMIGLDSVADAAPVLRSMTVAGGLYLIDDVVLDATHREADEFSDVPTAEETTELVRSLGDQVERRVLIPAQAIRSQCAANLRRLERSAAAIAEERPKLRRSLKAFLTQQHDAASVLTGPIRPTIWAIRRGR